MCEIFCRLISAHSTTMHDAEDKTVLYDGGNDTIAMHGNKF